MHLWNAKALSRELKENKLSERQKFSYFLLYVVLTYFAIESTYSSTYQPLLLESIGNITIGILGTLWCFRINQKNDGTAFIERFICLGIPVVFRAIVLVFITFFVVVVFDLVTGFDIVKDRFLERILGLFFGIVYFFWLARYIDLTSRK